MSPDALQQVAGVIAENPLGVSAFGAAAAVLLATAVRKEGFDLGDGKTQPTA